MKKLAFVLSLVGFMVACNSSEEEKTTDPEQKETPAPAAKADDNYEKGLNLVATGDCTACHKINEKLIGPAYADVAAKYEPTEENITMLAGKVIKGGVGVWGQIPMTPHPDVTEEDAKEMIKYILSLKK